jgi:membrane protein implicated in regulation of membrane protease activity
VALSLVLAAFTFVIVLMGSREPVLALEFAGVAFIVALVAFAMLTLAARPKEDERADIEAQNRAEQLRDEQDDAGSGH